MNKFNYVFSLVIILFLLVFSNEVQAAESYSITTLGFRDIEHTDISTGGTESGGFSLNNAGQGSGFSYRYIESTHSGMSAWFYDSSSTEIQKIGFTGDGYTRSDGYKYSYSGLVNSLGQVTGNSARYDGMNDLGRSAWFYDSSSNTIEQIGLLGSAYIRDDGFQYSSAKHYINDIGQTTGVSERFNEMTSLGQSAWFYDSATNQTQLIGLLNSNYTRSDGYQYSDVYDPEYSNYVLGTSNLYTGMEYKGRSAYLYDIANNLTVKIGPTGSDYIRSDGYQYIDGISFNANGQVSGNSYRYSGSLDRGISAWLYDHSTEEIREIGLMGEGFARPNGYRVSSRTGLNDLGQVIGISNRFSGSTFKGSSAWFYDSITDNTEEIGLVGDAYVRSDGYRRSRPDRLNNIGQVLGTSIRYDGLTELGNSIWFYDSATRQIETIGLMGGNYVGSDGAQYSEVMRFNNFGQAVGVSFRYDGMMITGEIGWFYDFNSKQIFDLSSFIDYSDDYTFIYPEFLDDDGTVVGHYGYSRIEPGLGIAFKWSMEGGFIDLGRAVSGGLDSNGWRSLYIAYNMNDAGVIAGNGHLSDNSLGFMHNEIGSPMAFLLTPENSSAPIPEPTTVLLFGAGLAGLAAVGRRRKS